MHNNVFYIESYAVFDDSECTWAYGRRVSGSNNWVHSGASYPAEWTGTVTGGSPGFTGMAADLFVPAAGSTLIDAGAVYTSSPEGSPFPDPLPQGVGANLIAFLLGAGLECPGRDGFPLRIGEE